MLGILLKKQLAEVFRSYFYNAKKNKMRSRWAVAGWFVFFVAIMAGMLGGMFTFLSMTMCRGLVSVGMGWLYFLLMGGIAIVLGAFGSVFNTYAGLYLSRDNNLLLSLPIPVRTIIAARLANVYLMGAMYAATALLPALIVHWAVAGATAARVVCGIALFAIVTVVVLLLSCLLGWVVARISLKLKNKSFITVLVSLLFVGAYYFFYFRASGFLRDIIQNAGVYGAKIKGAAYGLYLFGRVGEGSWAAAAIFLAGTAAAFALVWIVLIRSFLMIATDGGRAERVRYTERTARRKTPFGALLGKEFSRFTASPNYMLNCGLGVLILVGCGVALLAKGREVCEVIGTLLAGRPDGAAVLLCAALCLISSLNDMAAPSVSLEGKSLWIPQSLPVEPRTVLRAKASVQMILTGLSLLFAAVCAALILKTALAVKLLICVLPLSYAAFSALFGTAVGVRMPLLNWTSETAPIKQGGAVVIALFSGWIICAAFGGLYLLIGYKIGAALYLLLWALLFAAAALALQKWLDTEGARAFAAL